MAKFLTSARSVDMLGRQQIAGIPTAVSEIFKNAYDAYATSVRGDFFPDSRILMIRDNGVGMSLEDFQNRWLTVGTDSKAQGSGLPPVPRPPDMLERRQMGEKGIGRLAIATTGSQLLIASRSQSHQASSDDDGIVFALIQWSLFEIPGLTLDDVTIPVRKLLSLDQADATFVESMRDELAESVTELGSRVPAVYRKRVRDELKHLSFDPRPLLKLNGPNLATGSGTAFIVSPVSPDVDAVMEVPDEKNDEFSVSEFQRFLLGFSNTITPVPNGPDFSTEFIRHDSAAPHDIIDPNSYFWNEEDFENTDHTIEGEFDEYGSFSGNLSVYGLDPVQVNEPWRGGNGNEAACGPFRIKFGYVQGTATESRLTPEDFVVMTSRLEKIGGLYVYRDGIRVLPYGNSDNDYLEIEKRRSLNAATYYFSYRRMFGAIDIESGRNKQLQEKAGREGFRENRAYRDFKDILQNFLVQLAAHSFSKNADTAERWRNERSRLAGNSAVRAEKRRAEIRARERFSKATNEAIHFVESGKFAGSVRKCVEDLLSRLEVGKDAQILPDFDAMEGMAIEGLNGLRSRLDVRRPDHLPLSREEERDWMSLARVVSAAQQILDEAALEIQEALEIARSVTQEDANLLVEGEARLGRLQELIKVGRANVQTEERRVIEKASEIGMQIASEVRSKMSEFNTEVSSLLAGADRIGFVDEIRLTGELNAVTARYATALDHLLEHAQSLSASESILRENLALKEEILDLQEQTEGNLELLQLGQAVQIVSHEFEASIRSVRNGLKQLTPWAKATPRLQPIVRDLRASFAHLDGYLRLFTPLQRRLYREAVLVSGEEIEIFLRGVFDERLQRHEVELSVTEAFRRWHLEGYPSTFYPTFVNIVDNAIHWVASEAAMPRIVQLDADDRGAYVRDNGPGIRPRDKDAIFERGFSRRRGGRGLGLSLARELLARDGWTIELLSPRTGTEFRIARELGEQSEL